MVARDSRHRFLTPAALRGDRGLSLLEIAVTITILTSVTLGTTLILVPVARQSRINRETAVANAEARKFIERIHAIPFRDILPTYADNSEFKLVSLPDGTMKVNYADPTADPLEIHMDLGWQSPDLGPIVVTFVTVRTE